VAGKLMENVHVEEREGYGRIILKVIMK